MAGRRRLASPPGTEAHGVPSCVGRGVTAMPNRERLRVWLATIAAFLLTWGTYPAPAEARLLVHSPERVLSSADAVVVGTVASRAEVDGRQEVTLRVERALKGDVPAGTVRVVVWPPRPLAQAPDAFPGEGTRVFVSLRGREGGWGLASELNAVAVVREGHVTEIYRGAQIGIDGETWTPMEYVRTYDAFYQSHRPPEAKPPEKASPAASPTSWWTAILQWLGRLLRRLPGGGRS